MCNNSKNQTFIEKAIAVHGDVYDYSLTCYVNSKEKVQIICKEHGVFEVTPNGHLRGNGCKSCGIESRASKCRGNKEDFIKKATEIHGDRYDYSNVEYINSLTEVEIICKEHGKFLQTPKIHYKSNCPKCGREAQIEKARKDPDKFIEEAKAKYGDKYDYSLVEYINNKTPIKVICSKRGILEVIPNRFLSEDIYENQGRKKTKSTDKEMFLEEVYKIYGDKNDYTNTEVVNSTAKINVVCKEHGEFSVLMHNHFNGQGCPKCSAENYRKLRSLSAEEYYRRVNEKHDNKYTYTEDYTTLNGVVTFFCEKHGKQRINAGSHLAGTGCKKCTPTPLKTNKRTKEGYCKLADGRDTHLYLIECYNENERFYKIGKTFRKMKKRYIKSNMPYDYKILHTYTSNAEDIWDLEEELHLKYVDFSYRPKLWFAGHSECYNLSLPIQEIIKL